MSTEHEEWRPVPGWPGYEASDHGRAMSRIGDPDGQILATYTHNGYPQIAMQTREGKRGTCRVHTLVLETFVGPRPNGMECRHLDGDRTNNHLSNLCWGTRSENSHDRFRHGKWNQAGEASYTAKLNADQVKEILQLRRSGLSYRKIANLYGVSSSAIYLIGKGKTWSSLAAAEASPQ